MPPQKTRGAVFLDRDGTLNVDVGYASDPGQLQLLPGAVEAVCRFNSLGMPVIVITNQSGVARGFLSEEKVREMNRVMMDMFAAEGAKITAFYYCPHHPEAGEAPYRKQCTCRKPGSALFLQAAREHHLDFSESLMIGDKLSDVYAGLRLGITSILVLSGEGRAQLEKLRNEPQTEKPDYVAADIAHAAEIAVRLFGAQS